MSLYMSFTGQFQCHKVLHGTACTEQLRVSHSVKAESTQIVQGTGYLRQVSHDLKTSIQEASITVS